MARPVKHGKMAPALFADAARAPEQGSAGLAQSSATRHRTGSNDE
jgi:hypothetical protein